MPETKHTSKEVQPMQHTPGPWSVAENYGRGPRDIQSDPKLDEVVASTVGLASDREDEANAALIAASPELREALANLVEATENLGMGRTRNDAKALLTRLRNVGA